MKTILITGILFVFRLLPLVAQVSITSDSSAPDSSSMLDVKSTSKGVLIPRLTQAQISQIQGPSDGLMVYCTTDGKLYVYVALSSQWKDIAYGSSSIVPPFLCGASLIVNHVAGNVAPVNKSVLYGTVKNLPGEPARCWITRNLGASQQANSVDDATEASAGWYWQFNRKQGYKHDGAAVVPAWTVTAINESSDWLTGNDPCSLELGVPWRLPTYSEWFNTDNAGGWTNWNDPWSSALKLHAAGYLVAANGSLSDRGLYGSNWSGTQINQSNAWGLSFYNTTSNMDSNNKASGVSVRCIR